MKARKLWKSKKEGWPPAPTYCVRSSKHSAPEQRQSVHSVCAVWRVVCVACVVCLASVLCSVRRVAYMRLWSVACESNKGKREESKRARERERESTRARESARVDATRQLRITPWVPVRVEKVARLELTHTVCTQVLAHLHASDSSQTHLYLQA